MSPEKGAHSDGELTWSALYRWFDACKASYASISAPPNLEKLAERISVFEKLRKDCGFVSPEYGKFIADITDRDARERADRVFCMELAATIMHNGYGKNPMLLLRMLQGFLAGDDDEKIATAMRAASEAAFFH